ncbi:MAG: acyl-CoA thioesterase [Deltaproteobacteria bacterium]|nr:acyl-CoA thioesterase [Deltaproteobacteria bacterium]
MWVSLPIVVRSTDLDEYSHVNNAKFVEYLEWGRYEWFDRSNAGEAFSAEKDQELGAVIAKMEVSYLQEARRGDALSIRTALVRLGGKSMRFRQCIFNGEHMICEAQIIGVLFDLQARRSLTFPQALRARLEPLVVVL